MTKQKFGLTGTALKTIALVLMVMDHIHYFFEFTGIVPEWFSMLARLSAPLFLFCTVEGFAHTHDRRRYFLRIWAIGAAMGTVEFFMIYAGAFRRGDGFYPLNAIFQDLMLLCIIWQGIDWLRQRRFVRGALAVAMHLKDKGRTPELGIVNFDAHFDLRPYDMGNSSGTMFRQMADVCRAEGTPYHYFPIGIQQHSNTVSLFKKARELGVDYVLAKEIQGSNMESILERMDTFLYRCRDAYITVCTDVFSSAFAPGVSAPQSLGLDPEVVLPLLKHVLRTRKVRGFDICEISPRFDQDNTTANLGAVIIFAVVNTLCRLNGLSI